MESGMRRLALAVACIVLLAPATVLGTMASPPGAPTEIARPETPVQGGVPKGFLENQGQIAAQDIRYYSSAGGVQFGFARGAMYIKAKDPATGDGAIVRATFPGAAPVDPVPRAELPQRSHFFVGEPDRWRTQVRSYGEIRYPGLWAGIDLVFAPDPRGLKYEYRLEPGASPSGIVLAFEGVKGIRLDGGELVLRTPAADLRDAPPVARQGEEETPCAYLVRDSTVRFSCPRWDPSFGGVIDPLIYGTYLGGSAIDDGRGIAVDGAGYAYVTGQAASVDFPTTPGAFRETFVGGPFDVYVAKLDRMGTAPVYSTFLGGDADEVGLGIAVDGEGNVYVTGQTHSANFPVTPGAYDTVYDEGEAFVTKLAPGGDALLFSTFLGGSSDDGASGIALDASNNVYVTGTTVSMDFPTTPGVFGPTFGGGIVDGYVAKLSADGSSLVFGSFLGGSREESGHSIAVDSDGSVYVTGGTTSSNFPTTAGAFDTTYNDVGPLTWGDAFVVKISPTADSLLYGTFLGGELGDIGRSVVVGAAGVAYVVGATQSLMFPVTPGAYDTTQNGGFDAFVVAIHPSGASLNYGTFIGGTASEDPYAIAVDAAGTAYIVGSTTSVDFPTTPDAFSTTSSGGLDVFLARLNAAGDGLLHGTYFGGARDDIPYGIALDPIGSVFVTGLTLSADFPVSAGAFDTTCGSDGDCNFDGVGYFADGFVVNLRPGPAQFASITVDTTPPGLQVLVNGTAQTAPFTFSCLVGTYHTVEAVSPQVAGPTRYSFSGWSDGGARVHSIACTGNATITATFGVEHSVTIETSPAGFQIVINGTAMGTPQTFWWAEGSSHTLAVSSPQLAAPDVRGVFASWSDAEPRNRTVVIAAPTTYTANFGIEYAISMETAPSGLELLVDGSPSTAPFAFWCAANSSPTIEAPDPLPGPDIRLVFVSWSDAGAQSHAIQCTAPQSFLATFGVQYRVTITSDPPALVFILDGTTLSAPHTFWCPDGEAHTVDTPSPQGAGPTRFTFWNWSDGGGQSHAFTCSATTTLTEMFLTEHLVTITTSPPNLEVIVNGTTLTAPQTFWWREGSSQDLEAPSPQGTGPTRLVFDLWSNAGGRAHSILVTAPATITATFATEHEVTILTSPPGLDILVDAMPFVAPQTFWWRNGSAHSVSVDSIIPGATGTQYAWRDWNDGGARSHQVTVVGPATLTATFRTQHLLTAITPHGQATCDLPDCWYDAGTFATLQLDQVVPGPGGTTRYAFREWTGDVTDTLWLLPVLMDGPKTTTAVFATQHYLRIVSTYGNATGEDWYDEGEIATFGMTATEVRYEGRTYRFRAWTGDVASADLGGTIAMDGPKLVEVVWEEVPDITWLLALPFLLVAILLLVLLILRRRRKKEAEEEGADEDTPGEAPAEEVAEDPFR